MAEHVGVETIQAKDVESLAKTINELKDSAKVFIGILILIFVAYQIWRQLLTHKREEAQEESKTNRAKQYLDMQVKQTEALSKLAESMTAHTASDVESANKLNNTLQSVETAIEKLDDGVSVLSAKTSGQINREDSTKMIRDRFLQNIYKEICMVIERSLTENDYEKRKDFVARKVRTALGDILIEARKYLCGFNLAVDPNRFFMCEPNQAGIERFTLCDSIWREVEPLFKKESSLKQRIEEAYLIVENVISDYVTLCGHGTDSPITFRRHRSESNAALLMAKTTRLLTDTGSHPPTRSMDHETH